MKATLLIKNNLILGESPLWHDLRKTYWWLDIEGKQLFEYDKNKDCLNSWKMNERPSLLVLPKNEDEQMVIAQQNGLLLFNLQTTNKKLLITLEPELPNNRTNDGGCDSAGRLWIGTMDSDCAAKAGAVYTVNEELKVKRKITDCSISNGLTWNIENNRMYFIDSASYAVQSFLFNAESSDIHFNKKVIEIPATLGMPDGMCIDSEGMLWIAQWGSGTVNRWNPNSGEMLATIEVPAPHVTSCAFAGEELDELLITTARQGLTEEQLKQYPLSGSIFIATPGVRGIAKNKFVYSGFLK